MVKEKKISVSLYLNKKMKSIFYNEDDLYPIYLQVNYDRKNTQFPVNLERFNESYLLRNIDTMEDWHYISEEMFDDIYPNIKDKKRPKGEDHDGVIVFSQEETLIHNFINVIENIESDLRFEINDKSKDFKLKGFGKRFLFYRSSIMKCYDEYLSNKLLNGIAKNISLGQRKTLLKTDFLIDKIAYLFRNRMEKFISPSFLEELKAFFVIGSFIQLNWGNESFSKWIFEREASCEKLFQYFDQEEIPIGEYYYKILKYVNLEEIEWETLKKIIIQFVDNQAVMKR